MEVKYFYLLKVFVVYNYIILESKIKFFLYLNFICDEY